ncbi:MAG: hypothetical protein AAB692_00865, partial [Patescibacteria group bacterium]
MYVARVSELVRWNLKSGKVYAKSLSIGLEGKARKVLGSVFGVLGGELPPKAGDSLAAVIEQAFLDGLDEAAHDLRVVSHP